MSLITEAKKGNLTEEMKLVAADEGVEPEFVRRGLANGRIVIPVSPYRYTKPCGIGKGLRTKVNASIGTSSDIVDIDYNSIKYGIIGGIAAAGGTILYFLALQQAPISKVAPVVNMNLIIGVLLGVILLKDAMNLRIAAGIVLAVTSIYLLTNGN